MYRKYKDLSQIELDSIYIAILDGIDPNKICDDYNITKYMIKKIRKINGLEEKEKINKKIDKD